jgi:hypothetical protein
MQKLVWRGKLVADFGDETVEAEVEVARFERDRFAVPETLGLSLAEGKRLTAAIQTEMGPCTGDDDGRALPVLRALRIDLVQQRIPIRHVSMPLRQRAASSSSVRELPMP